MYGAYQSASYVKKRERERQRESLIDSYVMKRWGTWRGEPELEG
jgi:hypothetical protein